MIRFVTRELKKSYPFKRLNGTLTEITGNFISGSHKNKEKLDDSIMAIITKQTDALGSIKELFEVDDSLALTNILFLFESPRVIDKNFTKEYFTKNLNNLNKIYSSGKMTKRETLLASGSLRFNLGDYATTIKLLETSLLDFPQDALTLKLLQECYIIIGDTKNVLNCLTRGMHIFEDKHHLHGHMLGMLTCGYLENGLYSDAEEVGSRSVQRTNGRDAFALHCLLNAHQVKGRNSEGNKLLGVHQSKHNSSGNHLLLFNQGNFFVQRGNYLGATKCVESMIDSLNASSFIPLSSITNATSLLLLISLNKFDVVLGNLWLELAKLVILHINSLSISPIDYLSCVITLSIASNLESFEFDTITEEEKQASSKPPDEVNSTNDFFSGFRNLFTPGSDSQNGIGNIPVAHNSLIYHKAAESFAKNKTYIQQASNKLRELKDFDFNNQNQNDFIFSSINTICPDLLNIMPDYKLSFQYSSHLANTKHLILSKYITKIANGFALYGSGSFREASVILNETRDNFSKIGGLCVNRDIFEQTMIESFLRDEQYSYAKLLLCERTSANPNDSQSWRRLAAVFGRLNMLEKADTAHYTAWQLGIGQGGFGGPT